MRITFSTSPDLPADVAAALVPGEFASTLILNEGATAREVASALTSLMQQWVDETWIYVGRVEEVRHLRAL